MKKKKKNECVTIHMTVVWNILLKKEFANATDISKPDGAIFKVTLSEYQMFTLSFFKFDLSSVSLA